MKKYEKTGYLHHDFKIFHLTDHEMSTYDFHYHDFHKLLFFLSGNVTYCIEGKSYQLTPGDLVLVRAGEVHRPVIHDTTPYERMIIYVSPDFAVASSDKMVSLNQCFLPDAAMPSNVLHLSGMKARLESYRERILKGSKFSTLATLYSEDPGSAKKGGELGFFSRGDMVSEFENAAFALQDGEISPVIETQYGFHIIQMIERRGNQVNCRHILLQPKVSDAQLLEAKKELDSIKSEIEKGAITFEDAIVKYSDDESKINQGLIINPYTAGASFTKDAINETMNNVEKVDFNTMKEGDVTRPVLFKAESANAYRLIKVNKKIPAHRVNLTDDYGKIQESALSSRKLDIIRDWAEKRIAKTYIRIIPDYQSCEFKLNWLKK